jgi:S-adenosylmethionine hydrolase
MIWSIPRKLERFNFRESLIALFGSSGHLMIAVVNGRATDRLHPSIGGQVEVMRQT